ncbi:MAG: MOSC domain-containing protein [Kastovskya adunca ATA6-11-RM4]|jgi:hypothetical protein|nr:MOSC domain-containing protein [Kastovskya adunca ATA6-11-RM4]
MTDIKLSEINIYPIKSAAGIALKTASVENRGLQYDRRWMLVDQRGKFISQRRFPRLALIRVQIEGSQLVVQTPNRDQLSIPLCLDAERVAVNIWKDVCEAIPAPETVSQWFSDFLELPCQLVYMPDSTKRPVDTHYAHHNESVSFADSFPFLLISEASLEDLNQRLEEPVPMNRFRPNLVVSGCEAFAEDSWRTIRIGSVRFQVAAPCSRCVVTTVDQSRGIRGKEPLQTLAQYRRRDREIFFGQNLIAGELGTLQLGDAVQVESLVSE